MITPADVFDAHPAEPHGTAVLLLAGSSGRIETNRAEMLAAHGARVRAIRWFGGVGQRPAPHEVPLELFVDEIDALRANHDRVALFGTSFGAEAALSVAAVTPVDATVAVPRHRWCGRARSTEPGRRTGRFRARLCPSSRSTTRGNPMPTRPPIVRCTSRACGATERRPPPPVFRSSGSGARCCSSSAVTIACGRATPSPPRSCAPGAARVCLRPWWHIQGQAIVCCCRVRRRQLAASGCSGAVALSPTPRWGRWPGPRSCGCCSCTDDGIRARSPRLRRASRRRFCRFAASILRSGRRICRFRDEIAAEFATGTGEWMPPIAPPLVRRPRRDDNFCGRGGCCGIRS